MQKKTPRKSVKSKTGHSQRPLSKKRQIGKRKSVSTRNDGNANTGCAKPSLKPQMSTAKTESTTARTHGRTGNASAATAPKQVSPQLQELERGRQGKELHEQGLSLAVIAEKFGCSKTLARDLVDLASLPKGLEEAYRQGKIGRKAVLEMARNKRRNENKKENEAKAKDKAAGRVAQNNSKHNSPPAMTEVERQLRTAEIAPIVVEWVYSLNLTTYDLESFWDQVNTALYRGCHWLFMKEAPKPEEIKHGADPWKVIERCKVDSKNANSMPDVINNHVMWLARWIQRVTPDCVVMKEALAQAETQLRREAQTTRWH